MISKISLDFLVERSICGRIFMKIRSAVFFNLKLLTYKQTNEHMVKHTILDEGNDI